MEKFINSRSIQKHDTEANWNKAVNFIPFAGELIIYDPDEVYSYPRFKIGDGIIVNGVITGTKVKDLPFMNNSDIYVGSGEMPDDCNIQIDPEGEGIDEKDLVTKDYVDEQISNIKVPKALSELTDDSKHRTVTDAEKSNWNAKSNFSGSYNDLTNKPTIPSINGLATETYVNQQISAIPTPDVSGQISTHNTSTTSHNDIRLLIKELTSRLNALANSTDEDLDQMAEIVAYIKSNKNLIDNITTNKVNVTDIINNLTTNTADKPLSAAQGVALKALIDAITVPTKTSQLTNDSKFLTSVPSEYITETELTNKGYAVKSNSEVWTFKLKDGTTVTKKVVFS